MARRFIDCAFIFLCCQILFVHSQGNTSITTQRPWFTQPTNNQPSIRLSGIVNVRKYIKYECRSLCELYDKHSPVYTAVNTTVFEGKMDTVQCPNGEWILKWNVDDLGEQFANTSCSFRTYTSACKYDCIPCICVAPNTTSPSFNSEAINSFSLHPAVSETSNNRVVTGFKLSLTNPNIIELTIQQAELLSNGSIDKTTKTEVIGNQYQISDFIKRNDSYGLEYGRDYISFSYNTRTMFLDEIFVPDEYIVTGVRLVEIDPSESHRGIKLQVKGNKYDSTFHLDENSGQWFDYNDGINQDFSYNLTRREIPLDNCTNPSGRNGGREIRDTNRFVRFRATDMMKDGEQNVIPFLSGELVEINDTTPLRGVGFSYKGEEGFGGYIIPKVFRHQSLIYTPDGKLKPKRNSATRNYCQFVVFTILFVVIFLQ